MHQPAGVVDPRELQHKLLNHIAVVSTNAHLLNDTPLDAYQAEIVSDIIASAKQALEVSRQLGASL
jgi:hypothetical protein